MKTKAGIIYIKNSSYKQIIDSFLSFYRGIGYVKFDGNLPDHYPVENEEFKEILISKNTSNEYYVVIIEEFQYTFEVAYNISKQLKNVAVAALRYFSTQESVFKVYINNDVLLKTGSDEDHELMFYPPRLDERSLTKTLNAVGNMSQESLQKTEEIIKNINSGKKINTQTIIDLFNFPNVDYIFAGLNKKKYPENFEYILLINKRSALYLNM